MPVWEAAPVPDGSLELSSTSSPRSQGVTESKPRPDSYGYAASAQQRHTRLSYIGTDLRRAVSDIVSDRVYNRSPDAFCLVQLRLAVLSSQLMGYKRMLSCKQTGLAVGSQEY